MDVVATTKHLSFVGCSFARMRSDCCASGVFADGETLRIDAVEGLLKDQLQAASGFHLFRVRRKRR